MQQVWKMPKWMERYRELIRTRGQRSVEDVMSDTSGDMNSPHAELRERSMSNYAVAAQINLLNDLYQRGLLTKDE
jgi:hypothetical protein